MSLTCLIFPSLFMMLSLFPFTTTGPFGNLGITFLSSSSVRMVGSLGSLISFVLEASMDLNMFVATAISLTWPPSLRVMFFVLMSIFG